MVGTIEYLEQPFPVHSGLCGRRTVRLGSLQGVYERFQKRSFIGPPTQEWAPPVLPPWFQLPPLPNYLYLSTTNIPVSSFTFSTVNYLYKIFVLVPVPLSFEFVDSFVKQVAKQVAKQSQSCYLWTHYGTGFRAFAYFTGTGN